MVYREIKYLIRAGLGRNEWALHVGLVDARLRRLHSLRMQRAHRIL